MLHIDNTRAARENGYYAMVLRDVDMWKEHPDCILIEVVDTDVKFWQKVEVGRLPDFCQHCKNIGHVVSDCNILIERWRNRTQVIRHAMLMKKEVFTKETKRKDL